MTPDPSPAGSRAPDPDPVVRAPRRGVVDPSVQPSLTRQALGWVAGLSFALGAVLGGVGLAIAVVARPAVPVVAAPRRVRPPVAPAG